MFTELGLDNSEVSDEQLIDAMVEHPITINRPIVMTDKGVVLLLCRSLENIFSVLQNPVSEFTKELLQKTATLLLIHKVKLFYWPKLDVFIS